MFNTIETVFNNIIRFNPKGKNQVKDRLNFFLKSEEIKKEKINDYFILEFKTEYLIIRKDREIFKSFKNKKDAVDYCLDKINTESPQIKLF